MKKPYVKPMAAFENYSLDMPIASGCSSNAAGIVEQLKADGYFGNGCYDEISYDESGDNSLNIMYGDDKICYYTLADMLFTS